MTVENALGTAFFCFIGFMLLISVFIVIQYFALGWLSSAAVLGCAVMLVPLYERIWQWIAHRLFRRANIEAPYSIKTLRSRYAAAVGFCVGLFVTVMVPTPILVNMF